MRMALDWPVFRLVTTISEPMGSVRCAAVRARSLKTWPLAALRPFGRGVPGGQALLGQDGPVGCHIIQIVGADPSRRRRRGRNARGRRLVLGVLLLSLRRHLFGRAAWFCGDARSRTKPASSQLPGPNRLPSPAQRPLISQHRCVHQCATDPLAGQLPLPVQPVGKVAQRIGHRAQGGDRLAAHLRNHAVVHIGDGVAQLHLDHFDGLFNAAAHAARAGAVGGIRAQGESLSRWHLLLTATSSSVWGARRGASMADDPKVPQSSIKIFAARIRFPGSNKFCLRDKLLISSV